MTKKSYPRNPEIWKLAKNQCGPKTEAGKLKVSVNSIKHKNAFKYRNKGSKLSKLSKLAKCSACPLRHDCPDFDPDDKGCQVRYNAMVEVIKRTPTKQLDEVLEMEDLFVMLKGELTVDHYNMLITGDWAHYKDFMYKFRTLTDTLEKLHKMKHGSKVTVKKEMSYADVQNQLIKMSKVAEAEVVSEVNENDNP